MKKKLTSILLIDDDEDCNFFHKRVLNKLDCVESIHTANDGQEALDFLTSTNNGEKPDPSIIFLDINMPVMNGWDFLEGYQHLSKERRAKIIVIMLTTSLNPDDRAKALANAEVKGFENKYLTKEAMTRILSEFFPDYL